MRLWYKILKLTFFAFFAFISDVAFCIDYSIPGGPAPYNNNPQTTTVTLNNTDTLNVTAAGAITTAGTNGVDFNGNNTITNSGTITANGVGIGIFANNAAATPLTITNTGTITGGAGGGAIDLTNLAGGATVNISGNAPIVNGTITGDAAGLSALNINLNPGSTFTSGGNISNFGAINVNSGIFKLQNNIDAGVNSVVVAAGAELDLDINSPAINRPITLNGNGILSVTAANGVGTPGGITAAATSQININNGYSITSGNIISSGFVNIGGNILGNGSITMNAGGVINIPNAIGGAHIAEKNIILNSATFNANLGTLNIIGAGHGLTLNSGSTLDISAGQGLISTDVAAAQVINLGAGVGNNNVINNGLITMANGLVANAGAQAPVTITNGSTGQITAANGTAIDLRNLLNSTPQNTSITNSGTITGEVFLPTAGGATFNITGNAPVVNSNITGDPTNLSIFNSSATAFTYAKVISHFSALNITAGAFTLGTFGGPQNPTIQNVGAINVSNDASFRIQTGSIINSINVNSINVNSSAINALQVIGGFNAPTIITAPIVLSGQMLVDPGFAQNVTFGNITSTAGSNINFQNTAGAVITVSNMALTGSTLLVNGTGYTINSLGLNAGSTLTAHFPVTVTNAITSNASIINANSNITSPSLTLNAGSVVAINAAVTGIHTFSLSNSTLNVGNNLTTTNIGLTGGSILNINAPLTATNTNFSNSTINLYGGSINAPINGAGNSTLNVNANFTTANLITNINNINVNSGLFRVASPVTGVNGNLTVGSGATLAINSGLSITGTGNYIQNGLFNPTITSPASYGKIQLSGFGTLNSGAQVVINVDPNNTITPGDLYDVITTSAGLNVNIQNLSVLSNSAIYFFQPSNFNGNTLRLRVTNRRGLLLQDVSSPVALAVGNELEQVRLELNLDQDTISIFNALDVLPRNEVSEALISMAPDTTGGMYYANRSGTDFIYSKIESRLELFGLRSNPDLYNLGYAAGDKTQKETCNSFTPFVIAGSQKQLPHKGFEGYRSSTWGFGVIGDRALFEYIREDLPTIRVGAGVTYSQSLARVEHTFDKKTTVESKQFIVYSSFEQCNVFFDGILGAAHNRYQTKRTMNVGNTITRNANGNYPGFQFSGKVRSGFVVPLSLTEMTPSFSLLYNTLRQRGYTERNAGDFNLIINKSNISALEAQLGLKLTYVQARESFLPEIHAYYIRELNSPKFALTSEFVGIGGPFVVPGAETHKDMLNVGFGVNAEVIKNLFLLINYDFETDMEFFSDSKHRYTQNVFSIRARFEF